MRVRDTYERYQVPPWLQLHQVRVAAVGKMVAEAQKESVDTHLVVSTCLLHDIGAIVKFDFSLKGQARVPGLCPSEDVSYWAEVQERIRARYGRQEKTATQAILQEIGVSSIITLFDRIGFARMDAIFAGDEREAEIVQYGDMRVRPGGIISLPERFSDARKRYTAQAVDWYVSLAEHERVAGKIEARLMGGTSLRPEDINDETAAPLIQELWDHDIA